VTCPAAEPGTPHHSKEIIMIEQIEEIEQAEYLPPAVHDLGTVTETTLGHAGANNPDDTQYFSNW
jgi:hypothetical protein